MFYAVITLRKLDKPRAILFYQHYNQQVVEQIHDIATYMKMQGMFNTTPMKIPSDMKKWNDTKYDTLKAGIEKRLSLILSGICLTREIEFNGIDYELLVQGVSVKAVREHGFQHGFQHSDNFNANFKHNLTHNITHKLADKFEAHVKIPEIGTYVSIGVYNTQMEAAEMYDIVSMHAAVKSNGWFWKLKLILNYPEKLTYSETKGVEYNHGSPHYSKISDIDKVVRVFEDLKRAEMRKQKEQKEQNEKAARLLGLNKKQVQSTKDLSVWMYNLRF